jgi:hypothetical protein
MLRIAAKFSDMAQPLLNLKDPAEQAPKKKKQPFSRPRKNDEGEPIVRAIAKKPKEPKLPVAVQPDVPEKKSQKRKYHIDVFKSRAACWNVTQICRKKEKYREKLKAKRLAGSTKKPEEKNKRNLKWCFGCRARGHTLENCPKVQAYVRPRAQAEENQEGSNTLLCFNCGSKGNPPAPSPHLSPSLHCTA